MIRCAVIKFAYIFKDHGEVKEILLKCELPKGAYGYIGSALVDSCNNHVCVVLGSEKWVACFVPPETPGDLFRGHSNHNLTWFFCLARANF